MIDRLVIFGATGDLTARFLLPGLAALRKAGLLDGQFSVTGSGREDWDSERFRFWADEQLRRHAPDLPAADRQAVVAATAYRQADVRDPAAVADVVAGEGPVAAYLALPPAVFPGAVSALRDSGLPAGKAANAAAVMALTMGARCPDLVGEPLVDAQGNSHPGLIPIGIPVLGAPQDDLPRIRSRALEAGLAVVDFPVEGQATNDYAEFRRLMSGLAPDSVQYLGIMLLGPKKKVGRIVGKYSLLKAQADC